ncbi:MAG: hypothetical protein JWL90_3089 [Chthoniobacteraceae bacterium]|nr:hypothetical protein [Chthoniobacteraceae bacterium]
MTPRRYFYLFLGTLTLLRLFFIAQPELTPDESYYYLWSERMDVCYYSKGPGVAAALWLGTHLFGVNEFGIRFLSPLLSLGTTLLMFSMARRLYGESVGIWTGIMINVVPIFNVGSLLMTIDPLSIFFWTAALYTFWLALEKSPQFSRWWPLTGALIGMGFVCKYTNAMELLSILLLLLFTRKYRRELQRRGFYLMLAAFIPFTLPPVIWNAQHDWITLAHLSARGGLQKAFHLDFPGFLEFIAQHFGVYSPLIFGGMLVALWWAFPLAHNHFKPRFLLAFTLPLWGLYLWLSLKQSGEANWTAPAMISLAVLSVALWHEAARLSLWKRRFAIAALVVGAGMSLLTLDLDLIRRAGIPLSYNLDPSKRLRGWRTSAESLENARVGFESKLGQPVFLIGSSYGVAADLAFYLNDKRKEGAGHPAIYIPESQAIENQFSFWPRYDELIDLREHARTLLKKNDGPEQAQRFAPLESALAALPVPTATGDEADQRWHNFVRALIAVAPDLPIDEYASKEGGVSLFAGRSALYITDRAEEHAPSSIKSGFEKVEMISCIDQVRRGLPLRQWRIFACSNYRGAQL